MTKTNEESWGFAIDITYKCKHQCSHCCVESSPNGPFMPMEKIEHVLHQIDELDYHYGIGLTGGNIFEYDSGGKTLLDIVGRMIKLPGAMEHFRNLQFFMAPFGKEDGECSLILRILSDLIKHGFLIISLGYSLYAPDINRRLIHTLPILMQWIDKLTLVVTVDRDNDYQTGQKLKQMLRLFNFRPTRDFNLLGNALNQEFDLGEEPISFQRKTPTEKTIVVHVNPTLPVGRAQNWQNCYHSMGKIDCPILEETMRQKGMLPQGREVKRAYITLKGHVLPCYSTFPGLSPMGNVFEEPLGDILARRKDYKRQLNNHFRRRYRTGDDFCSFCSQAFKFIN